MAPKGTSRTRRTQQRSSSGGGGEDAGAGGSSSNSAFASPSTIQSGSGGSPAAGSDEALSNLKSEIADFEAMLEKRRQSVGLDAPLMSKQVAKRAHAVLLSVASLTQMLEDQPGEQAVLQPEAVALICCAQGASSAAARVISKVAAAGEWSDADGMSWALVDGLLAMISDIAIHVAMGAQAHVRDEQLPSIFTFFADQMLQHGLFESCVKILGALALSPPKEPVATNVLVSIPAALSTTLLVNTGASVHAVTHALLRPPLLCSLASLLRRRLAADGAAQGPTGRGVALAPAVANLMTVLAALERGTSRSAEAHGCSELDQAFAAVAADPAVADLVHASAAGILETARALHASALNPGWPAATMRPPALRAPQPAGRGAPGGRVAPAPLPSVAVQLPMDQLLPLALRVVMLRMAGGGTQQEQQQGQQGQQQRRALDPFLPDFILLVIESSSYVTYIQAANIVLRLSSALAEGPAMHARRAVVAAASGYLLPALSAALDDVCHSPSSLPTAREAVVRAASLPPGEAQLLWSDLGVARPAGGGAPRPEAVAAALAPVQRTWVDAVAKSLMMLSCWPSWMNLNPQQQQAEQQPQEQPQQQSEEQQQSQQQQSHQQQSHQQQQQSQQAQQQQAQGQRQPHHQPPVEPEEGLASVSDPETFAAILSAHDGLLVEVAERIARSRDPALQTTARFTALPTIVAAAGMMVARPPPAESRVLLRLLSAIGTVGKVLRSQGPSPGTVPRDHLQHYEYAHRNSSAWIVMGRAAMDAAAAAEAAARSNSTSTQEPQHQQQQPQQPQPQPQQPQQPQPQQRQQPQQPQQRWSREYITYLERLISGCGILRHRVGEDNLLVEALCKGPQQLAACIEAPLQRRGTPSSGGSGGGGGGSGGSSSGSGGGDCSPPLRLKIWLLCVCRAVCGLASWLDTQAITACELEVLARMRRWVGNALLNDPQQSLVPPGVDPHVMSLAVCDALAPHFRGLVLQLADPAIAAPLRALVGPGLPDRVWSALEEFDKSEEERRAEEDAVFSAALPDGRIAAGLSFSYDWPARGLPLLRVLSELAGVDTRLLAGLPRLGGCHNPACTELSGPTEGALKTKVCARCRMARWCSVECQRVHWKHYGHKRLCTAIQEGRALARGAQGPS